MDGRLGIAAAAHARDTTGASSRSACAGVIRGVNVDTQHFTGNYPVALLDRRARQRRGSHARSHVRRGRPAVDDAAGEVRAARGQRQFLRRSTDGRPWTHVRLNIFPDGGVARLRVYGEASVDWTRIARRRRAIDLASIMNGGLVLGASDMHFGAKDNMIMPGRATNMGDGWETRRRRGPGHDWAIVRLGTPAIVSKSRSTRTTSRATIQRAHHSKACLVPGVASSRSRLVRRGRDSAAHDR